MSVTKQPRKRAKLVDFAIGSCLLLLAVLGSFGFLFTLFLLVNILGIHVVLVLICFDLCLFHVVLSSLMLSRFVRVCMCDAGSLMQVCVFFCVSLLSCHVFACA